MRVQRFAQLNELEEWGQTSLVKAVQTNHLIFYNGKEDTFHSFFSKNLYESMKYVCLV